MNEQTKKYILGYLKNAPLHKCLVKDVQEHTGLARDTVVKYLEVLVAEGTLEVVKIANAKAYRLSPGARRIGVDSRR